jgi:hypothetical protein
MKMIMNQESEGMRRGIAGCRIYYSASLFILARPESNPNAGLRVAME